MSNPWKLNAGIIYLGSCVSDCSESGQNSPINVVGVLVNYPQTRKSQMTKLLKAVCV